MNYSSLFSCEGKSALVVGGGGLLGREVVLGLAAAGATVFSADTAVAAVPGASGMLEMDIASPASITAALGETGALDIVVNCAYPRTADWGLDVDDVPFESLETSLVTHLGGYIELTRQTCRLMAASGGGSIINFGSTYGVVGPTWDIYEDTSMTMPVAYSAIKGGVVNATRFFATKYGPHGVRVNCVSPGGIHDAQDEAFVRRYAAHTPLERMGEPSEIVGAVVFLASGASSYVTGHNLLVDGGWTAW